MNRLESLIPITAFSSRKPPSGKHKMRLAVATNAESGSLRSPQDQRTAANGLRPAIARISVLSAAPNCHGAIQIYRNLSMQFDSLTQDRSTGRSIVYRQLGYGFGLMAYTGARLDFIDDLALHEDLQSLASEESFAPKQRQPDPISSKLHWGA
ncbi:hypothetical protein WH50_14720 [Pokkaliibacter plantistimulans]|uniref:Uncharacterized protein n=1 Tax=Pokkaliibacter plantistimulans TaxID=1635171 RepID=A0ABX5LV90_9GAMM|nr:hypothetical protein WH50_14720 [Pokkaliibacter plantistimulans]